MPRRTATRTASTRVLTRVIDTPWGRTVTCVAPGAPDDHTIALFSLGDAVNAVELDAYGAPDLFNEYDARTYPAPLVEMAPAVEQPAPVALLVDDAPAPPAAPPAAVPVAVEFAHPVRVHFVDTLRELRQDFRAGELVDGDVYAVDGMSGPLDGLIVAGVVVAGALVDLGSLPDGETWETFHGGRYVAASRVAQDVREGH